MLRSGKRGLYLNTVVTALVALATALPASAGMLDMMSGFRKPNMKWGLLEIHPWARVSETYDSNIYLVPKNKPNGVITGGGVVGSWITAPGAGLKLALPISAMHKIDAAYSGEGRFYSKQPKANNNFHQAAELGYGFNSGRGLTGSLRDSFMSTTDPAFSELVQREQRWNNVAAAEVGWEGGRLGVSADGSYGTNKYLSTTLAGLLNRYDIAAGVRLRYRVMPKTRAYLAYHRGISRYTADKGRRETNNKNHHIDLGVDGDLAPKLKGQIQAGLVNRWYDGVAPVVAGANPQKRSYNSYTVATRLTWQALDRTMANLTASRMLQESTFKNNRFYENNTVSLGVQHRLPYKLTAGVNLSAGWDKYPVAEQPTVAALPLNRRDDLHQQAVTLDYDMQSWLRIGAAYLHRTRWAKNFTDQFNYEDHQTTINLGVTF